MNKKLKILNKKKKTINKKLKILFVSSELFPFAKTGGLADFVAALPLYLKKMGLDVYTVIPKYSFIKFDEYNITEILPSMGVWMGDTLEWAKVWKVEGNIPVYLIEHNLFFDREGLYHDNMMNDYQDNPKRFAFLSRAAIQLCKDINIKIDVFHSNDWQTALVPYYLKTWDFSNPLVGQAASVLTIHNAAYQGSYPNHHYKYLGINPKNFTSKQFESFGSINLLKGGIFFADIVNTVSKGYANEIKAPYGGFGLAPYLNDKGDNFIGILNGVDYNEWNPKTDTNIPHNYDINTIQNKAKVKKELQKYFQLEEKKDTPILGVIGRFVEQKGYHLLVQCIRDILDNMNVQFTILGAGDKILEAFFASLPKQYTKQVGTYIGYNNKLAHLIEAGSDFFIMPSMYEPCGLNQLYSLKYGTLPIVRATGGLDDTVINYNENTGKGTGFKFYDPDPKALYYTVGWAVSTYFDRKQHLKQLIKNAMSKNYSWQNSAKKYIEIYKKAINNKKEYNKLFL